MSLTPFMGMDLPVPTVTLGPAWATQLNSNIGSTIDSHNHTSGKGAPVPSAALDINAALSFQNNNATNFRSVRFFNQGAPISLPTDLICLYASGGNLYYNDGLRNIIQLTVGGALNATSIGGIGGDYTTSSASVFYTALSNTFTFWQSSGVNATLDVGDIIVRAQVASAFGVRLTASASMAANYTVVLPVSLPPAQRFMTLDAAGNIAAPWSVDGTTIQIVSNQLAVQPSALNILMRHQFEANGRYAVGNFVDGIMMFRANATTGGTLNLQITSTTGTTTPLTGSYYKLTRLPAVNTGAFV
jgi:hypothetical protein